MNKEKRLEVSIKRTSTLFSYFMMSTLAVMSEDEVVRDILELNKDSNMRDVGMKTKVTLRKIWEWDDTGRERWMDGRRERNRKRERERGERMEGRVIEGERKSNRKRKRKQTI